MGWVSFLLGRPGSEYTFEVPPEAMTIAPTAIKSMQRNIRGNLKKSLLRSDVPGIKINSSYLTMTQRNQFAALMGVGDSFLSFINRNDWQMANDLASIIDLTHLQLTDNSALALSAAYVQLGLASLITIGTIATGSGPAFGTGTFGGGAFGIGNGGGLFDPGAVTYSDANRLITMTNPLASLNQSVYVTYTYPGWLVEIESMSMKYQGGWIDRASYDISLVGA